jgi:hypothetical protein
VHGGESIMHRCSKLADDRLLIFDLTGAKENTKFAVARGSGFVLPKSQFALLAGFYIDLNYSRNHHVLCLSCRL